MNKICKGIIWRIALVLLIIVFMLNLIFTAHIDEYEFLKININNINIIISIIFAVGIYVISYMLEKNKLSKISKGIICAIIILVYLVMQIVWINCRASVPAVDQKTTYKFAVDMVENIDAISDTTYGVKMPNAIYMQCYQQQFTIAFLWSILFRIFSSTSYTVVQYFNAVCNCITILAIYLITKQISKMHKTNKYLAMILIITFATIPLLSTFVYGDESALAFSLLGVYFLMKYTETEKWRWNIISAICISISYLFRMNSLIFIIATFIYLGLDLIKEKAELKKIITKIVLIVIFVAICMIPASIVKNYFCQKYDLDKKASFPATGYFLMGMTNGAGGIAGWYNFNTANMAYENLQEAKEIYPIHIKAILEYYMKNPQKAIAFYVQKTASMWTENTYAGIYYNLSPTFCDKNYEDKYDLDTKLTNCENYVYIYQKALILIIFGCSIIVVIKNRKNLSNELILLLTIFIGGFLFHTLWEAKSRYIIPYIIVLIPVAAVKIKEIEDKFTQILGKIKRIRILGRNVFLNEKNNNNNTSI